MRSHYEVLGVKEDAGAREINAAYRRLAKKHHPDKGGDPASFQRVTEAYNVLKNRPVREAYDFEHKFESFLHKSNRRTLRQRIGDFLRRRAFAILSVFAFFSGILLLDWGDGINEDFNPVLLGAGCGSILLSMGFYANRRRLYEGLFDALLRAVFSILLFLFDVAMRVYLILVVAFSAVALLALLNWIKKNYLHLLPHHF
ncbi:J domain-containing protein [Methylocystis parvus]|uniref:J domain-containing protein n=1 Tax=Methylocystis parvus TaxID=134 RepID=A0A6B8MBF4_9HYPH|nr:J domain-containing protein [Methylocystis parvus]QGM98623.1 J domain-containing protein [Methylocystis parvus]WBK01031.1 J domain-containing protein [Methylocystis parvus OBBP]